MPGEARPFVHLQQQFGDLDARQDHRRLVDQGLRGIGHRRIERRDLQARLGDDGIRQAIGRRHAVDGGELRFQQRQPLMRRYWSQSVATASGNSLACLRLARLCCAIQSKGALP